jgi:uncharacterized protein YbaP (TraB family)
MPSRFLNPSALFLLLFLLIPSLHSEGLVWKVDGAPIYIGGTIHLLKATDYPLPAEYEAAYLASEQLYFETDLDFLKRTEAIGAIQREGSFAGGQTLEKVLSQKTCESLKKIAQETKTPWATLQPLKPWMAVSILTLKDLKSKGFEPDKGVEHHFWDRAIQDRKKRVGLETFKDHLKALSSLDTVSIETADQLAKDFKKTPEQLAPLLKAWKSGDEAELERLLTDEIKSTSPDLLVLLLLDRNYRWVPTIKSVIQQKKPTFILVGSGHLVGQENLIELLKKESISLSRYKAPTPAPEKK